MNDRPTKTETRKSVSCGPSTTYSSWDTLSRPANVLQSTHRRMNYFGARGSDSTGIHRCSDQRLLTVHALFHLAASVDVNEVGDV